MTLGQYLIGMSIGTVFSWAAWVIIIINLNPYSSGIIGLIAFYISLFLALVGTIALLGFFIRVWISRKEVIFAHVGTSFRQAILLAIILIGLLLLQSFGALNWWVALLFVSAITLLEFYFLSREEVV